MARGRSSYFDDYARRYTDLPLLVVLKGKTLPDGRKAMVPDRYVRASDFPNKLDQSNNPDWKTVGYDELGQGAAQRLHRLPLGYGRPSRPGPVEPGEQGCPHGQ